MVFRRVGTTSNPPWGFAGVAVALVLFAASAVRSCVTEPNGHGGWSSREPQASQPCSSARPACPIGAVTTSASSSGCSPATSTRTRERGPPRWGGRRVFLIDRVPALRSGFIGGTFFYVSDRSWPWPSPAFGATWRWSARARSKDSGSRCSVAPPERRRPRVQIELHGDWRTGPRHYGRLGSRAPRPRGGPSERLGGPPRRSRSGRQPPLEHLARTAGYRGEIDRFIAFSDSGVPGSSAGASPRHANGRLHRRARAHKAVDVLLDAWPLVLREIPDARLWLVGAGSMHDELHRRVEASPELTRSVEFKAPMPRYQLAQLIDRSTCLVLPSASKGYRGSWWRQWREGRAVVASTVGGMRELIDETNGRLVEPEDVAALAKALDVGFCSR